MGSDGGMNRYIMKHREAYEWDHDAEAEALNQSPANSGSEDDVSLTTDDEDI